MRTRMKRDEEEQEAASGLAASSSPIVANRTRRRAGLQSSSPSASPSSSLAIGRRAATTTKEGQPRPAAGLGRRPPRAALVVARSLRLAALVTLARLAAAAAASGVEGDLPVAVAAALAQTETGIVLLNGFLVFFMQVGFVALETGSGRAKNVRNILLKNLVDVMLCALCWWAVGYAFAYGRSAAGVIGVTGFFYEGGEPGTPEILGGPSPAAAEAAAAAMASGASSSKNGTLAAAEAALLRAGGGAPPPRPWFFSWTFAVACVTVASGCLAERTRLAAYPAYTLALSALVHPLLVHWVWGERSWLNAAVSRCPVLDFAGGTVVHMAGGLFGLVGAALCGPRLGRFEGGAVKDLPGHDMAFVTLGTFMLWTGWYGFNSGSAYLYSAAGASRAALERTASRATINTTLGGSAAGLVALLVSSFISGTYDLRVSCNGVLSGLVTATPMCGFVEPWAAAVAGALSGAGYIGLSRLLLRLRIDDPLDSAAVHFGSGTLGTLLLALAAKPSYVATLIPTNAKAAAAIAAGGAASCGGVFYSSLGWTQLGMQVLAVAVVTAFTGSVALAVFWVLRRRGLLRVDHATELAGIDNMDHGGPAYPEFGGGGGGGLGGGGNGGGGMRMQEDGGLVRH